MTRETPPPVDPLRALREAYDQAVQGWSKAMEQVVASEDFAAASGRLIQQYVDMQDSVRSARRGAAEGMHVPTAEDLARLATLITNVERKVDEVSDETHAIAQRLSAVEDMLRVLVARRTRTPRDPKD